MYNQVHQAQIAAGETTLNIVEIPVVQEQIIVQEIPQAPQIGDSPLLLEDCYRTDRCGNTGAGYFSRNSTGSGCGADTGTIVESIEVLPH